MILGWLTRFPGISTPARVLTGNPALDGHLVQLDRKLLGSAKVRMQTLAEVKNHVEERHAQYLVAGIVDEIAATQAVEGLDFDALAEKHRAKLLRKFVRLAIPGGLFFGVFMAVFMSFVRTGAVNPVLHWLLWMLGGVCFGLLFGWIMAFVTPERQLPSTSVLPSAGPGSLADFGDFVVSYGPGMRVLGLVLAVGFGVLAIGCLSLGAMGLFESAVDAILPAPSGVVLLFGVLALFDFYMVRLSARRYKVSSEGIQVRDLLRRRRQFSWAAVRRVGSLGDLYSWLPYYWKRVRYVEFDLGGRKPCRLRLYQDMINADRLFALLLRYAGENQE